MKPTRTRILEASLRLFARDGFEASSTSAIAGELGMTKSALYKHFPDKQAIFDSLVDEMLALHRTAALEAGIEVDMQGGNAQTYAATSPEDMVLLGEALFEHWTASESAVAFRRMLSIERFRSERAASVYDEFFVGGRLAYYEGLFTEMVELGVLYPSDVAQMALDFWAPIYLLMQATDGGMTGDEATRLLQAHILEFAEKHARNGNG